jgi:hypothetical protein
VQVQARCTSPNQPQGQGAATVRWAERQEPGAMDAILSAELVALRAQMRSAGVE